MHPVSLQLCGGTHKAAATCYGPPPIQQQQQPLQRPSQLHRPWLYPCRFTLGVHLSNNPPIITGSSSINSSRQPDRTRSTALLWTAAGVWRLQWFYASPSRRQLTLPQHAHLNAGPGGSPAAAQPAAAAAVEPAAAACPCASRRPHVASPTAAAAGRGRGWPHRAGDCSRQRAQQPRQLLQLLNKWHRCVESLSVVRSVGLAACLNCCLSRYSRQG